MSKKVSWSLLLSIIFLLGFVGIFSSPQKASALIRCDLATAPNISVDINGQTFTSSGSFTVPSGTALPFTVYTYSEPSSVNGLTYPSSTRNYVGPDHTGRIYNTTAISTPTYIFVWLSYNCDTDFGEPPPDAELMIDIGVTGNPPATINVQSNVATSWTVAGPSNFSAEGSTYGSYSGPAGTYTLTADTLTCYDTKTILPSNPLSVNSGGEITFTITYGGYTCGGDPDPEDPPTVDLKFNDSNGPVNSFTSGSSGTLSWSVTGATSCVASGGTSSWNSPSSKTAPNGTHTQSSGAINSSTSFYINCSGPGGSASDAVAINVAGAPPQLCEDPTSNNYGGAAPCTYPPEDTACTVSASPSSGSFPLNDVDVTVGINNWDGTAHEFNIDCTNNGSYELTEYLTTSPNTFADLCDYPSASTLKAHVRNLATLDEAICTMPIANPNATLSVSPGSAQAGTSVTASWANISSPSSTDWVGVYPSSSTANNAYVGWFYVRPTSGTCSSSVSGAASSGGCTYGLGSLPAGSGYEMRLFSNNGYTRLATSNSFTILPATTSTLSASPTSLNVGASTNVTWNTNGTAYGNDWIGQYVPGAPDTNYLNWKYTSTCSSSGTGSPLTTGSCSFALNSTGTYEFRLFSNGGYTKLATSNSVVVSNPTFNYILTNSGTSSVTKSSGNAFTQNTVTKTLTAGSGQSVSLALSGVPSGVSYSISNSVCSPTCTSTITFTVAPSAPSGSHTITVTGSPLSKQTSFTLAISGSPITVSCSASPATALIGQTVTWSSIISGGAAPYRYSWSGTGISTNPSPSNSTYNHIYTTIGQKSAALTVTTNDGVQATCPAATVQVNFDPIIIEF